MAALKTASSIHQLVERAQAALDRSEPDAAVLFLRRAVDQSKMMEHAPAEVYDMLAEVEISIGETERAERAWLGGIERSGNSSHPSNAERNLYIAQLKEGNDSRRCCQQGIEMLEIRLENMASSGQMAGASVPDPTLEADSVHLLQQKLCAAYCALADLYLTDLCFEESAEQMCQESLDKAMRHNVEDSYEPIQSLASLRLSQHKNEEASQLVMAAYARIVAAAEQHPVDFDHRFAAARILLECAPYAHQCADAALDLLSNLMREDDENIEIWFLMGVGFFQQSPPDIALSREYLNKAGEMLDKERQSMASEDPGGEFPLESQVQLVNEQLALVDKHCEEHGTGDGDGDSDDQDACEDDEEDEQDETRADDGACQDDE